MCEVQRKAPFPNCDKTTTTLLTTSICSLAYPVVLIEVEEVKCRALIDTGTGASYASSTLMNHIKKPKSKPKQKNRNFNDHKFKKNEDKFCKNSGHQLRVWL